MYCRRTSMEYFNHDKTGNDRDKARNQQRL